MSEFVEVKTAELVGPALDWCVCMIVTGAEYHDDYGRATLVIPGAAAMMDGLKRPWYASSVPDYSSDWALGGPLLEKFNSLIDSYLMDVAAKDHCSCDELIFSEHYRPFYSEISLPKICRAVVAANLGDVVQVPKDLIND